MDMRRFVVGVVNRRPAAAGPDRRAFGALGIPDCVKEAPMSPRHHPVKPALAAASAALLALGLLPGPVGAVVPVAGGAAAATSYSINVNASVDAYDAHVDGNIASYTAGATIRYYNFFTGTDAELPTGPGAIDLLSDVNGNRIVFTRLDGSGARVMVFDVSTSITTPISPAGSSHVNAAIGSNTVALIDQSNGVLNVATIGGALTPVTDGSRLDQMPAVSPAGSRVVYESCPALDPSNCDIHQATASGSGWGTSTVTSNAQHESNPDTDGILIVYDALRADTGDVCWVSVSGGSESCLEISGTQRNPSVSSGVIVFESGAPADIYVYETSTNRLFQVTSTPADESLNDVYVGAAGSVRAVWASEGVSNRDVYGMDLELPPVGPGYTFGGLQAPVDPLPTLNSMKAGAAVPVKFSLGGDFGLDIFATGDPKSQVVACDSTAPVDGVEQTLSAGGSGLTYDAASGLYTYVWKTDKAWAGTCRQLVLTFADGTVARANFKFK